MKIFLAFLAAALILVVAGVLVTMNGNLSFGSALVALGCSCLVISFNCRRKTNKRAKVVKK